MPRLNIRLDRQLDRGLREYAKSNKLNRSQAARELLRQILGVADPVSRGWLEGFSRGYADGRRGVEEGARRVREEEGVME